MPTNPTPVTVLLDYPDRGTPRAEFTPKANQWVADMSNVVTPEINAIATVTYNNAVEATNAAGSASADAATATEQAVIATNAANTATAAAVDFTATSSTSTLIGLGNKTFAIETGKAFVEGQVLRIVSDADVNNYMVGQITAASDGSITVDVVRTGGSGTFADWVISIATLGSGQVDFLGGVSTNKAVVTSSANVTTLDCSLADDFVTTLTENTTITLTNLPSTGSVKEIGLTVIQDASASGYLVSWPAGSEYEEATAPTLTTTASAKDLLVIRVVDGTDIQVKMAIANSGAA